MLGRSRAARLWPRTGPRDVATGEAKPAEWRASATRRRDRRSCLAPDGAKEATLGNTFSVFRAGGAGRRQPLASASLSYPTDRSSRPPGPYPPPHQPLAASFHIPNKSLDNHPSISHTVPMFFEGTNSASPGKCHRGRQLWGDLGAALSRTKYHPTTGGLARSFLIPTRPPTPPSFHLQLSHFPLSPASIRGRPPSASSHLGARPSSPSPQSIKIQIQPLTAWCPYAILKPIMPAAAAIPFEPQALPSAPSPRAPHGPGVAPTRQGWPRPPHAAPSPAQPAPHRPPQPLAHPAAATQFASTPAPSPAAPRAAPDAASLLSEIAAATRSLTQIAAAHNIPFPQFTLWLLQPGTQQQLTELSRAVASAARLGATTALPEVVHSLKRTLAETSTPEAPHRQTLFPIERNDHDGPNRGQVFRLRRQRIALSASYLLLRIARLPDPATAGAPARERAAQPAASASLSSTRPMSDISPQAQPQAPGPLRPQSLPAAATRIPSPLDFFKPFSGSIHRDPSPRPAPTSFHAPSAPVPPGPSPLPQTPKLEPRDLAPRQPEANVVEAGAAAPSTSRLPSVIPSMTALPPSRRPNRAQRRAIEFGHDFAVAAASGPGP